jgi:hypothetical protein
MFATLRQVVLELGGLPDTAAGFHGVKRQLEVFDALKEPVVWFGAKQDGHCPAVLGEQDRVLGRLFEQIVLTGAHIRNGDDFRHGVHQALPFDV